MYTFRHNFLSGRGHISPKTVWFTVVGTDRHKFRHNFLPRDTPPYGARQSQAFRMNLSIFLKVSLFLQNNECTQREKKGKRRNTYQQRHIPHPLNQALKHTTRRNYPNSLQYHSDPDEAPKTLRAADKVFTHESAYLQWYESFFFASHTTHVLHNVNKHAAFLWMDSPSLINIPIPIGVSSVLCEWEFHCSARTLISQRS